MFDFLELYRYPISSTDIRGLPFGYNTSFKLNKRKLAEKSKIEQPSRSNPAPAGIQTSGMTLTPWI